MVIVQTSSGYTYEVPDSLPPAPIIAAAVVSGSTQLNTGDGDGKHLVLHGTLAAGEKYIVLQDSNNVEKLSVDKDGKISCPDIGTENFSSLDDSFLTLDQAMVPIKNDFDDATSSATDGTLVRRKTGASNFTSFDQVESEVIRALGTAPSIALYGQGSMDFVPLDSNGAIVPNAKRPWHSIRILELFCRIYRKSCSF